MKKTQSKRKTFRGEMIGFTMAACICAMLILGTALILISMFSFSNKAREDMDYIITNVNKQFQDKVQFLGDMVVSVRHNTNFDPFFLSEEYQKDELTQQLSYSMDLFSERNIVESQEPYVESIYLFNRFDDYVSEQYYPLTVATKEDMDRTYEKLELQFKNSEQQYEYQILPDRINLCFRMYDEEMQEIGIGIAVINQNAVKALFHNIEAYNDGAWMVYTDTGWILASQGLSDQEREEVSLHESSGLTNTTDCGFGIYASSAVGIKNIYVTLQPTIILFAVTFILILMTVAGIVFFISYRFTQPLKEVAQSIRVFGDGTFDVTVQDYEIQEFHEISVVFNDMTARINHLVTQVYEKQLLASQAQIKYLQSQMDPHFQFNILSMLAIKSKMGESEEVYQGLVAFSKLMQGKIFRDKELRIPLSEEMELVEFYLYLQNSRFQDKIQYQIGYGDETVKQDMIPRLTIEPLVENAVSHGLEPKSGAGKISVNIFEQDGTLRIVIEDDGVGFDENETKKIEAESEKQHTHTGISNTNRLIHTLYGDGYGIHVEGRKGIGTRVEVILPIEKGEQTHVENNDS
ncbi:MAG: sensor histidine kinase [Hespellia sp.]|nr:sensor histidine kinase [Hespellia sp.]